MHACAFHDWRRRVGRTHDAGHATPRLHYGLERRLGGVEVVRGTPRGLRRRHVAERPRLRGGLSGVTLVVRLLVHLKPGGAAAVAVLPLVRPLQEAALALAVLFVVPVLPIRVVIGSRTCGVGGAAGEVVADELDLGVGKHVVRLVVDRRAHVAPERAVPEGEARVDLALVGDGDAHDAGRHGDAVAQPRLCGGEVREEHPLEGCGRVDFAVRERERDVQARAQAAEGAVCAAMTR